MDCGITVVYSCLGVTGTLLTATGLLSVRIQGVRVFQVITGPRIVTWCRGSWPQLSMPLLFISWLCLLSDYLAGLSYPLSLRTPYSWCHLLDLRRQAALILLPICSHAHLASDGYVLASATPRSCHPVATMEPHSGIAPPVFALTSGGWPPLASQGCWCPFTSAVLTSPLRIPVGWWPLDLHWKPTPASVLLWRVDPWRHCRTVVQFILTPTIQSSADSTAWGQSHPQNCAQIQQ